ncbi:MAG: hypothetical protein HY784_08620, partial [Chloroflexi bacterium]|nr:hypothetical protein [Chloroflexota bacterium]
MKLTLPRLVTAILFIGVFAMATRASVDSDTWWHLRAGAWMVEHRQILTHDEFSNTRYGQAWINHSWLSQIPMYWLWSALGYAGLNLMTAALVTLAFFFVYRQCAGNVYLKAFTLVLAAAASGVYWSARPQIFSFALAGAFAYVLHLFRWQGVNRLWVLVPLTALWVNLHGGFAIGFILLAITLAGQAASNLLRQSGPGVVGWRGVGWLAGVGLACAAIVPLNPFGAQMLLYPLRTVSIGVLQQDIQEWASPDFHLREAQVFIWLLLATVAAIGLGRRRIDLTDLLLISGLAYLALVAARNIAIFALVAPPVIVRHAAGIMPGMERNTGNTGNAVLNWALLVLVTVAALIKVAIPLQASVNEAATAKILPAGAAEFVAESRPPGPMFNSYNWGGYLVWRLYPDYPVFVDGRTELYPNEYLEDYLGVTLGRPGWRETL